MAIKPFMSPASTPAPRFNPTAIAIAGAFVFSIVLATVLVGNPFLAARRAYFDYSRMPAATVTAPAPAPAPPAPAPK